MLKDNGSKRNIEWFFTRTLVKLLWNKYMGASTLKPHFKELTQCEGKVLYRSLGHLASLNLKLPSEWKQHFEDPKFSKLNIPQALFIQ
jgi:hypothetical protein